MPQSQPGGRSQALELSPTSPAPQAAAGRPSIGSDEGPSDLPIGRHQASEDLSTPISAFGGSNGTTITRSNISFHVNHWASPLSTNIGAEEGPPEYTPSPAPVEHSNETQDPQPCHLWHRIYTRHLLAKKRGIPLWIPETNQLHNDSQREGIRIGDVGIVTDSGAFICLFNICLPHDDPINPSIMPEDFSPLNPPLLPNMDCWQSSELTTSWLASPSVTKLPTARNDIFSFETTCESGILVIPDQAVTQDLINLARFDRYIDGNLKSWYRYAKKCRGYPVENGDLRVVIGWDKTSCWGMGVTQAGFSHLSFRDTSFEAPTANNFRRDNKYTWSSSGKSATRVGPSNLTLPVSEELRNQCLFLRSRNPMLSPGDWAALRHELAVKDESAMHWVYVLISLLFVSWFQLIRWEAENEKRGVVPTPGSPTIHATVLGSDPGQDMLRPMSYHPGDAINKELLSKVPNTRMVLTCDEDWYSVLDEGDISLPEFDELWRRITSRNEIHEENGVVTLRRRPGKKKALIIACGTSSLARSLENLRHNGEAIHQEARAMGTLLQQMYNYDPMDVRYLLERPGYELPTRANILKNVRTFVKGAQAGDQFFFYLSGSRQSECSEPSPENEMDEYISGTELQGFLVDSLPPRSSLTAIFDSCHSGSLLDLPHYKCNSVHLPFLNKGKRRKKDIWRKTVRNRGPMPKDSSETMRSCDGFTCMASQPMQAPSPIVISISAATDAPQIWEGEDGGSLTATLANVLSDDPHPLLSHLLTMISFRLHASYRALNDKAVNFRKQLRQVHTRENKQNNEPFPKDFPPEMFSFQAPQLASSRPLPPDQVWDL